MALFGKLSRPNLKRAAVSLSLIAGAVLSAHFLTAQTPQDQQKALENSFRSTVKPFFEKNCQSCHNSDLGTAGVRTNQLDSSLDERQIRTWEAIRGRLRAATMPPKGMPQPAPDERERVVTWITQALEAARLRPAAKNGMVRRLTLAQYRNTLRELLGIDDDVTVGLPADAMSKDGFLNNKDAMQLSPLLTEQYLVVAEEALNSAIVAPGRKPVIHNFRMDLGVGVNPAPLPETLILGADSALLDNADFLVTQLTPVKPFPFEPFRMRTKYRYLEGYRGNDTVRGWRDFDSIYHAVFADMRGTPGYPKGKAWSTVPEGLLLRPAIPAEEIFGESSTYGPRANFKISVREMPPAGRFRVTVTAAKYRDGLLLDAGADEQPASREALTVQNPQTPQKVMIAKAGVYQVDLREEKPGAGAPDASRLGDGLTGVWPKGGADSPVGKALASGLTVPRKDLPMDDAHNVGEGDFTVAAWIHPKKAGRQGIVSLGNADRSQGWYLELAGGLRGAGLRFQTAGRTPQANAAVTAQGATADRWTHIAVVARRGRNDIRIYMNGVLSGRAPAGYAQFDDPEADLMIGHIPGAPNFDGEIADVRLYCRPLDEPEIRALVEPGSKLVNLAPERKGDVTLQLGDREFVAALRPAFLVVRLDAGPFAIRTKYSGLRDVEAVTLTPLSADGEVAKRFAAFEKRSPRLGVHLGLRRDCGSTFAPVGLPQTVESADARKYVFEGTLRNFPRPDVDKDNVNYLAGLSEIGVRSEYTDSRDMPRLLIRSVEFEGPYSDVWPPASHTNLFTSTDGHKIIHDFAAKAYRRPLAPEEEVALSGVFDRSIASGRPFAESVKDALLVTLTSPQFLFLTEASKSPAPEPLSPYELASKLSYWLWNGPPDRKTLQLAAAGTLRALLDAEVARLVADAKFARFASEFASQWLSLDKFQVVEIDRRQYPKLTRDAKAELLREPAEFVQYLMRNNLPVKNIIASDFVMANDVTADYYGLAPLDSGFTFAPVKTGRKDLGGVLTLAATMSGLSDGRESNPVKRGAWLARKIIAEPPNDPPPNVPPLKEETKNLTLRERLELHRSAPACAQCHAKIDPWGVALEEFDAGGRMKTKKVDAGSKLPDGAAVAGIEDLKRHLSEDRIDQVAFSMLKHLTIYAEGRSLTYNELNSLKQDALRLKPNGYRMRDMLLYVANSKVFLEK